MKKIALLFIGCLIGIFMLAGCSDSECNTHFGGAAPPPPPQPEVRYNGFYNIDDIETVAYLKVTDPMAKGGADELFLANPKTVEIPGTAPIFYKVFEVYSRVMSDAVFGSTLNMPLMLTSADISYVHEWQKNVLPDYFSRYEYYAQFEPVPGTNAFYAYPGVLHGEYNVSKGDYCCGVSYNWYEGGVLKSELIDPNFEFGKLEGGFCMLSYSPSDSRLYVYTQKSVFSEDPEVSHDLGVIYIYNKTATGHNKVGQISLGAIPELKELHENYYWWAGESGNTELGFSQPYMSLRSMLAGPDGTVYIAYRYANRPNNNYLFNYFTNFTVAKLTPSGSTYKFKKYDDLYSEYIGIDDAISSGSWAPVKKELMRDYYLWNNALFMRLSWGPEGKIICTSPVLDGVKLLDPSNDVITLITPFLAPNAADIKNKAYYLSAAWNPTTGFIYVLAIDGIWDWNEETTILADPDYPNIPGFPKTGKIFEYRYK